jgi:hypothetical protein
MILLKGYNYINKDWIRSELPSAIPWEEGEILIDRAKNN